MIKEFILKQFENTKIINQNKLKEYVDYCFDYNLGERHRFICSHHHILPRAQTLPFTEYSNLDINKWNGVYLQHKHHYIAHFLLAQAVEEHAILNAFAAMHNKDSKTNRLTKDILVDSEEYQRIKSRSDKITSNKAKGKVVVKDIRTSKNLKVTQEEFRNNPDLVGATHGFGGEHLKDTISVIDKNEKVFRINKSDYNPLIHRPSMAGRAIFKDKDGNKIICFTDDERVISGELVGSNKGITFDGSNISKSRKENGTAKGNKNPNAQKIALFDNTGEVKAICFGNLQQLSVHFGFSVTSIYNTILKDSILYDSKRMASYAKNRNLEQYIGWYARKITSDQFNEYKNLDIIKFI